MTEVLFIITDLEGGGAEKALISLLREFDYTKYKVTLCLMFHRGVYLDVIPPQVHVLYLFEHDKNYLFRKAWRRYARHKETWLLSFLIRRKIKRHYDVIISYLEGYSAFWHGLVTDRGKRNISWIHSDMFKYHLSLYAFGHEEEREKRCYQSMDQLVFVSQTAMENFRHVYDINVPKCYFYNIINRKDIYIKSLMSVVDKEAFTITAIGSLIDVKGFDRLIRVAGMLDKDGLSFKIQIIGRGEKEQELKRLASEAGVDDKVHFLGFQTNPYAYLRQSDIFVSTSHSEGLSLVICEALVLGIPVVATDTAGASELLCGGEYGIVTRQDDRSIYNALRLLITDERLRETYREKSLLRARMFEVDNAMKRFYDLIR